MEPLDYKPSFSWGKANPNATESEGTDQLEDSSSVQPYVHPTSTSIHSFKFLDARKFRVLTKFPGILGAGSLLFVTFKGKNGEGIGSTYQYRIDDADWGQSIYDQMVASEHPGKEIFIPQIRNNPSIPYTRT